MAKRTCLVLVATLGLGACHLAPPLDVPDSAFKHDGQLTKRDVRAMTLARLAPMPGEFLVRRR